MCSQTCSIPFSIPLSLSQMIPHGLPAIAVRNCAQFAGVLSANASSRSSRRRPFGQKPRAAKTRNATRLCEVRGTRTRNGRSSSITSGGHSFGAYRPKITGAKISIQSSTTELSRLAYSIPVAVFFIRFASVRSSRPTPRYVHPSPTRISDRVTSRTV